MKKSLVLALAAFGVFAGSNAQAQSSTTLNSYVRIIRPITVSFLEEMSFGALYSTGATQTVALTPDNTVFAENNALRTGAAGISNANNPGGIVDASADGDDGDGIEQGQFQVSGEQGFIYTINASSTPMAAVAPTVGPNMAISNIKIAKHGGAGAVAAPATFTFAGVNTTPGGASDNYNIGGTLTVAAGQAAGKYKCVFTVSAAYN